ncbi:MAG: molybdenum cofactor biosynthesis protein MoaE [Candidatus Binatia bacterium]
MFVISDKPISLDAVVAAVASSQAGAITVFAGTTRDNSRGRRVLRLEYEAYGEMATVEFEKIGAEIKERWNITDVAIVHRTGTVEIGESSVVIAVSAPHRRDSIEACHFAIDRLKTVAPIWKKEYFEGGEVWVGSLADCEHGDENDVESG